MVQVVIVGFLIGAMASWGFRVWALIPLTLVIFLGVTCYHLHADQRILSAIADGLLAALAPQAGLCVWPYDKRRPAGPTAAPQIPHSIPSQLDFQRAACDGKLVPATT